MPGHHLGCGELKVGVAVAVVRYPGHGEEPQHEAQEDADHERVHLVIGVKTL